eukprot:11937517-Alexandrium_andersonii.AAC.1
MPPCWRGPLLGRGSAGASRPACATTPSAGASTSAPPATTARGFAEAGACAFSPSKLIAAVLQSW